MITLLRRHAAQSTHHYALPIPRATRGPDVDRHCGVLDATRIKTELPEAGRLASDPHWHDATDQLTSRWTAIKQAAETRRAPTQTQPPARRNADRTHGEPPSLGPPGPDLTPGW